jgi:predicted porin
MPKSPSRPFRRAVRAVLAAAVLVHAGTASAAVTFKSESGWSASFDGFVNAFLVSESGDKPPASGASDLYSRPNGESGFRVRTGFLPGLLGFTFGAPETEGLNAKARVGLYPQINSVAGARTGIGSNNLDIRELNLTVDGTWGQVLFGRALFLFLAKNTLTDMSLFAAGVPSPTAFTNGPTLGHIGFGYLYPSFGAQLRYTTPDLSGAKIAVSLSDPANVNGKPSSALANKLPAVEGEVSYAGKSGSFSYQAWLNGIYQQSTILAAGAAPSKDVTSTGGGAGVGVGFSGLDLLVSGFVGSGLGTVGVIDSGDALDAQNKERTTTGFLAQATYTIGKAKLGVNYGTTMVTKTDADKAAGSATQLDNRSAVTAGLWYNVTPFLQVMAEYSHAQLKWFGGDKQATNTISVGSFLFW